MDQTDQGFQVFVKPAGGQCNLACSYCYYLEKRALVKKGTSGIMDDRVLETYISQHIKASRDQVITFSWHGGEPTLLGLDYYRKITDLQKKYMPEGREVINGIQTNATLLNEEWCKFLAEENFIVGVSIDGPKHLHDIYRKSVSGSSTFDKTLEGYRCLQKHMVQCEVLCVVNNENAVFPSEVYRFFKELRFHYITFIPLVEHIPEGTGVTNRSVTASLWGEFLVAVFDEWVEHDIGSVKIQIIEEAARKAFSQEHTLCIFKERCGGVPVVEHNGDFYSCDHFVNREHLLGNIQDSSLGELLADPRQLAFGQQKWDSLPSFCKQCEVLPMCNGGCPKNRLIKTPEGEPGLNYLCPGYKRFFNHITPFVDAISNEWNRESQR